LPRARRKNLRCAAHHPELEHRRSDRPCPAEKLKWNAHTSAKTDTRRPWRKEIVTARNEKDEQTTLKRRRVDNLHRVPSYASRTPPFCKSTNTLSANRGGTMLERLFLLLRRKSVSGTIVVLCVLALVRPFTTRGQSGQSANGQGDPVLAQ